MARGQAEGLEYVNWKDRGCDLYPACLECPMQRCIEEEPRGRQKRRLAVRAELMKEMRAGGISSREIAAAFGVSARTVQRALGRCGNGSKTEELSVRRIPTSHCTQMLTGDC